MLNKTIAIVLTVTLLFCFVACNKAPSAFETAQSSNTEKTSEKPSSSENPSSESVNNVPTHTHNYSEATCTMPPICMCGATEGQALGHNYSSATCTSPKTCTRCGQTSGDALGHKFSEATCTEAQVCSVCKIIHGSALGHKTIQATCTKSSFCEKCGVTIGTPLSHDYSPATCTSPQICNRCGNINGDALGHNFSDATCTTPKICYRCETTADDALGHDFVNQKCTRCGKLDRTYLIEDIDYLTKGSYTEYTRDVITDNQGTEYSGHYAFYSTWNKSGIEFETKGKYKTFTGTAFLPYGDRGFTRELRVKIYSDDGRLLYQTNPLVKGCNPETFSVDITGVSILIIKLEASTFTANQGSIYTQNAVLTNAYLSK